MALSTSNRRKILTSNTSSNASNVISKPTRRLLNTSNGADDNKSSKLVNSTKKSKLLKTNLNHSTNATQATKSSSRQSMRYQQQLASHSKSNENESVSPVDCDDTSEPDIMDLLSSGKRFRYDSVEEFKAQEKMYEDKLKMLYESLKELKSWGCQNVPSKASPASSSHLSEYITDINRLEKDSKENLFIVKCWFDKQKNDLEAQFKLDFARFVFIINLKCVAKLQENKFSILLGPLLLFFFLNR
jgi:hypothetical protein